MRGEWEKSWFWEWGESLRITNLYEYTNDAMIRTFVLIRISMELSQNNKSLASIVKAHLKCPFGQALKPCKPQGLQSSFRLVSITFDESERGPNPNEGTVEQNTAVTGAFIALAICKGAESFT